MRREWRVVEAASEHLGALAEIERRAAAAFPDAVIPAAAREAVLEPEVLAQARGEGWLFVALEAEGRPVGFVAACEVEGAVFILEVDVAPEHQRQGAGRALLEAIGVRGCQRGLTSVALTTFGSVPWNAPAYRRMGFRDLTPGELAAPEGLGAWLGRRLEAELGAGLRDRVAMCKLL